MRHYKKGTMKAIVWTGYGSPEKLQLEEVQKPDPGENEMLIRIHNSTVTAGDCEMRGLKLPLIYRIPIRFYAGLIKPKRMKILGQEFSGKVEAVGKNVTRFKAGDRVFGHPGFSMGAYAQYIALSEDSLILSIPDNLGYEEAASIVVGGLESIYFLKMADVGKGKHVLINGAGGSIGTFGLQFAKSLGTRVTAVDSEDKHEMLLSIGADQVIDYRKEDFTKLGEKYDIILDVIGKASFSGSLGCLNDHGYFLIANPSLSSPLKGRITGLFTKKKVVVKVGDHKLDDLRFVKQLVESRHVKPVIDRTYPLEKTPEAHRYVEEGKKKGNVVISIN